MIVFLLCFPTWPGTPQQCPVWLPWHRVVTSKVETGGIGGRKPALLRRQFQPPLGRFD